MKDYFQCGDEDLRGKMAFLNPAQYLWGGGGFGETIGWYLWLSNVPEE